MKIYSDIVILGCKKYRGVKSYGCLSDIQVNKNNTVLDAQVKNIKKAFKTSNIFYIGDEFTRTQNLKNINHISNKYINHTNNLFALSLLKGKLKENNGLFICFNKVIFKSKIFKNLCKDQSCIWYDNSKENNYKLGLLANSEEKILNIFYNLKPTACGLYYLNSKDKKKLLEITENIDKIRNMFLFEGVNEMINQGSEIYLKKAEKNDILQLDSVKKINSLKTKRILL